MEKVNKYLELFKPQAKKWFEKTTFVEENYNFFQEFFKREKLEALEWADIQKLGDHLHCFATNALAKKRALGNPNHEIEYYRNSFIYLAYGTEPLNERIENFYDSEEYSLSYFGDASVSELVAYLFPDKFIFFNARDQFAAEFLDIPISEILKKDFVDKLISFSDSIRPVAQAYQEIVGEQTTLPLLFEVDQFFSWLFETYKNISNEQKEDEERVKEPVAYWVIAAGEGAEIWEECYSKGIIAIGWENRLGDLSQYSSKKEVLEKLKRNSKSNSEPTNDAKACWEFGHKIKQGDWLFVKSGRRKLLGCGIVESDYYFDNSRQQYKQVRKVRWIKKGSFDLTEDTKVALKTLTNITKYQDFVQKIKQIMEVEQLDAIRLPPFSTQVSYWWLNANPSIWNLAGTKVGEKQSYTSHNKNGNKRQKYKYFHEVKASDLIVGYVTSPDREIVAISRVTKGLYNEGLEEEFEFEIIEKLQTPVSLEQLQSNPSLVNCEPLINNQGSLFRLTQEEYEIIRNIIDEANIGSQPPTIKYSKNDALKSLFIKEDQFDQMVKALREKKNIILQGAPGVGKTYIAKRLAYTLIGMKDESKVEMIQFHQSYCYEDFIQGFRPNNKGLFDLKNGIFYQFCRKAQRDSIDQPYVFIIDEINRGNLSKILGELMMLIEPDKRGKEFAIPLAYSMNSDERFFIPENVFLIGTMNTADRSLAMVDYALRRRFKFITLDPEFNSPKFSEYLKAHNASSDLIKKIIERMTEVNQEISSDTKNLGSGYKIGHSYFCLPDGKMASEDWYREIIDSEIVPLLKEYWFDDDDKVNSCRAKLLQ